MVHWCCLGISGVFATIQSPTEPSRFTDCRRRPASLVGHGASAPQPYHSASQRPETHPMHAWLCTNPTGVEALTWTELPTPAPKAGEMLVEIQTSNLNFPHL